MVEQSDDYVVLIGRGINKLYALPKRKLDCQELEIYGLYFDNNLDRDKSNPLANLTKVVKAKFFLPFSILDISPSLIPVRISISSRVSPFSVLICLKMVPNWANTSLFSSVIRRSRCCNSSKYFLGDLTRCQKNMYLALHCDSQIQEIDRFELSWSQKPPIS